MSNFQVLPMLLLASLAAAGEPLRDRHGDLLPEGAVARLGTIQAHPNAQSIAFSADGRTIITTGAAVVRRWDAKSGRVVHTLTTPAGGDPQQVISANGKILARLGEGRLELVELATGRTRAVPIPPAMDGWSVILSADGEMAFISYRTEKHENFSRLIRVADGRADELKGMDNVWLGAAVFSPDAKRLVTTTRGRDREREIRFWDVRRSKLLNTTRAATLPLAFMADGSSLLSFRQADGTLFLIDPETGQPRKNVALPDVAFPQSAAFTRDGRFLAVSGDREVKLWDMKAGKEVHQWPRPARHLAFSPDGKKLAAVGDLMRLLDVEKGTDGWPEFGPQVSTERGTRVFGMPAGHLIPTWDYVGRRVQLWDWITGKPGIAVTPIGVNCEALWLSADGKRLHACTEPKIQTWDAATGEELRRLNPIPEDRAGADWDVEAARPSGDRRSVAVLLARDRAAGPPNALLVQWDVAKRRIIDQQAVSLLEPRSARLTPDLTGVIDRERVIDARTGRPRTTLTPPAGFQATPPIANSPDGRFLAGAVRPPANIEASEMAVWEAATGRLMWRATTGENIIHHASFAPDNRWLALGGTRGLELVDLAEGQFVAFHPPHPTPDSVAFGPSYCLDLMFLPGPRLIAAYADGTALVWELPKGADRPPSARMTDRTWDELADLDPAPAQRAVWALKSDPPRAVTLLRERLKSAAAPSADALVPMVVELGSASFARREVAQRKLRDFGHLAEAPLQAALARSANVEQQRRLKQLLEECRPAGPLTPDERRAVRAVQAIELIASAGGHALLQEWARGVPESLLTREAKAALERGR